MAKTFVEISLATKIRVLFSLSVLGIIAAALVVPWYFMELLAEQGVQHVAEELTRLRVNEWIREHPGKGAAAKDSDSEVIALYTEGGERTGEKGPYFIKLSADLTPDRTLDAPATDALGAFTRNPDQQLVVLRWEDEREQDVFRCFRAVRSATCSRCHDPARDPGLPFEPGRPVAMVDVTLPASAGADGLVWATRAAFLIGVVLATLLAMVLFAIITQRLILRPVRGLRDLADKVAEGDLSARSSLRTGDELQRLGESFNEMLAAITDQHDKLRAANRALDLKLHELAEANVTLFGVNKIKDEFLTNVSHELRTPLNSIIGFADLLADDADERTGRYGRNISSASKNLLSMINDLLDLAKIEAGKAEVHFDKVSVADVCRTLTALMRPLADKKQLRLRAELADDLPIIVTDASKLQQILYNLLSNAIKFTPVGGEITVSAGRSAASGTSDVGRDVFVSVADTGPGVAEADHHHVFEKFYQADRSLTRESAGTGLGLAISRELASLLGGRLELKSSPGHGAIFTLHLPAEAPSNAGTTNSLTR